MLKTTTLRKNYEFGRVYQKGQHVAARTLVLHYFSRRHRQLRLGVTASRQVKGSVARNRAKRLLREAYRLHEHEIKPGYDLILVGRAVDPPATYWDVEADLLRACRRAGLLLLPLQERGRPSGEQKTSEPAP
ncbi:MAG: ribonuclease P protein component [Eubacteriales bacterium]|nr:ribonuclease P protein component [Eubacteriales bacterium]